ncbi:MAG TPA: thiamine pyrophosphate-binding protein [Chloroflexota bacterium]|jgi:sulfopyruvate decarboxylase TPP-binding subunit
MAESSPASRARYVHDAAAVRGVYEALRAADVSFAAHVPDTLNYPLVRLLEADSAVACVACSREDEAVAMAMGAWLGGRWPVVLMEGSGLGMSGLILARGIVQRTPLLILASHNSALGELHDYHAATRLVTEPTLRALNVPYVVVQDGRDAPRLIHEAQLTVRGQLTPVALLFPHHSLAAAEGV